MAGGGLSQKDSSITTQDVKLMVKHSRLAVLSSCLCSYANKQGISMALTGSFVPGEAVPLLPIELQEEELSPSETQRILRPRCLLPASALLLHVATLCPPGSSLAIIWNSKT